MRGLAAAGARLLGVCVCDSPNRTPGRQRVFRCCVCVLWAHTRARAPATPPCVCFSAMTGKWSRQSRAWRLLVASAAADPRLPLNSPLPPIITKNRARQQEPGRRRTRMTSQTPEGKKKRKASGQMEQGGADGGGRGGRDSKKATKQQRKQEEVGGVWWG
jgi:hypothetical protein